MTAPGILAQKWTIENGEWVQRPFVLTITATGKSDRPPIREITDDRSIRNGQ